MFKLLSSFIGANKVAFALAAVLSLSNVLVLLAIFLLALAASAGSWQVALAGGAMLALRWLSFARAGLRYLDLYLGHKLMFGFITALRLRLFRTLATQGAEMLPAGQALQLMINLVQRLDGVYLRCLAPSLLLALAWLATSVILGIYAHWVYALLISLCSALAVLASVIYCWRASIRAQLRVDRNEQLRKLLLTDFFSALADWLALDVNNKLGKAELAYQQQSHQREQDLLGTQARALGLAQALQLFGLLAALLFASFNQQSSDLLAIAGFLLLQRLNSMYLPGLLALAQLSSAWRSLPSASKNLSPILTSDATSQPGRQAENTGELILENISFRYPQALSNTFSDFCLRVPAGQRLLLTGASGSGKSTLVHLLGALSPPSGGSISYAGKSLSGSADDDWRALFAISSQTRQVLNCSLREQLFSPASDAELVAALDAVGLGAWLAALPAGLDSRIGEAAIKPSGGQYQRIQMARVLLSPAPIWLLDEISNGLDSAARASLAELINARIGARSLIYISHAHEQLPRLDRRVELEAGRIVADYSLE